MEEPEERLSGRTCVVTGASSGIGEATALELARRGAQVVMVARDLGRTRAAAQRVVVATGNTAVEPLAADFGSMRETRAVGEEIVLRFPRVDALVNAVGALYPERGQTEEGLERTFAVDYLSAFLLTNLLLPTLEASAPARVVNVVCDAHFRGTLDVADLAMREAYSPWRAYARAKLAMVMFTYQLARRLDDRVVTANAFDPGIVRTKLGLDRGGLPGLARRFAIATRGISPEEAARSVAHVATSAALARVSGEYFDRGGPALSSEQSYDEVAARRLWRLSEELTGLAALRERGPRDDRSGPRVSR